MTSRPPIPLGLYELLDPIAEGGMGSVWRGRHVPQDTPVAIKFIQADMANDRRYVRAFRKEVEAAAALHHPHIIPIFDMGIVDARAASASDEMLVEGSQFLVMELAQGTLASRLLPMAWPEVHRSLIALLDALAHAHARGTVHRDIKPSNILFVRDGGRDIVKLADFGISHALGRTLNSTQDASFSGTPAYVAPEQLVGSPSDLGPWTDLYTLGLLAYEMATGEPAFMAPTLIGLVRAHLQQAPPALVAPGLPVAFGDWIHRLLEKSPSARFRHASDAAWALTQIAHDTDGTNALAVAPTMDQPIVMASPDASSGRYALCFPATTATDDEAAQPRAPVPRHWGRAQPPPAQVHLLGAGLHLYRLREMPVLGHTETRDGLWRALVDMDREQTPRMVLLTGEEGVGKGRLARWFAQRAFETGAANTLLARFSQVPGRVPTIPRMVARYLRCLDVTRDVAIGRIRTFLDVGINIGPKGLPEALRDRPLPAILEEQALALLRFIEPALARGQSGRAQPTTPTPDEAPTDSEIYAVLALFLRRLAEERPIVLWLDDAQWGGELLGFVEHLLQDAQHVPRGTYPVLVVATINETELQKRRLESMQLGMMRARGAVDVLQVAPLRLDEQVAWVRMLLGLDPELAEEVAQRSGGHPGFAYQLVGEWVEQGRLEPGPLGFCLRDGTPSLSENLGRLWLSRLRDAEAQEGVDLSGVLEIAAALGHEVDFSEWSHVCRQAAVRMGPNLLDTLTGLGLIEAGERSFRFAHPLLYETLVQRAQNTGRWEAHHRACTAVLSRLHAGRGDISERLAYHAMAAGEVASAIDHVLTSAELALRSQPGRTLALITQAHGLMHEHGIAGRRWARGLLLRAQALLRQELHEAAIDDLIVAEQMAKQAGWTDLLAVAAMSRGRVATMRGQLIDGITAFDDAIQSYTTLGDVLGLAAANTHLGELCMTHGALPDAARNARTAVDLFQQAGGNAGIGHAMLLLGAVSRRQGDAVRGEALLREAEHYLTDVGDRIGLAKVLSERGETARRRNALEEAFAYYERALPAFEAAGSSLVCTARANMGMTLLAAGRFDDAKAHFVEAVRDCHRYGRRTFLGPIHVSLAACAAGVGNWDAWDAAMAQAQRWLSEAPIVDEDAAISAETAARLAFEANQDSRGVVAFRIARDQWVALDRPQQVRALDGWLVGGSRGDRSTLSDVEYD